MKITDDIIQAIDRTINIFGSKSEFARKANISVVSLRKYLNRARKSIADDTWEKMYPLIEPYLPEKYRHSDGDGKICTYQQNESLSSDQRILLDAFSELPKETQEKKLFEIIELAKQELRRKTP